MVLKEVKAKPSSVYAPLWPRDDPTSNVVRLKFLIAFLSEFEAKANPSLPVHQYSNLDTCWWTKRATHGIVQAKRKITGVEH
jgi:hypothetical protein